MADSNGNPRETRAWGSLQSHAQHLASLHLRDMLSNDADRYGQFSIQSDSFVFDYSRCRVTGQTVELLGELATECGLKNQIERLFQGEMVNKTEERSALHTSLRGSEVAKPVINGVDIASVVRDERARFLTFADAVRAGKRCGHSGQAFKTVVSIGIGGSDLGPRFLVDALTAPNSSPVVSFVAGLDGVELDRALAQADPSTTLFIICSKTFSTLETMSNANAAMEWLKASVPAEGLDQHFAAVSANRSAVAEFGVAEDARFAMWDWVGGRYSVWSAVGVSVAIAIGGSAFESLLKGAAQMDQHFYSADFDENLPVMLALLSVWHQNFLGLDQHVVLPYDQRLSQLPVYLQQLWMESLGKRVRQNGDEADYSTGAALWGGSGSHAQHSYAQWLHQGSAKTLVHYIGTARGFSAASSDAHQQALANMLAQADALATGRQLDADETDPDDSSMQSHQNHPGNRPSIVLLMRELSPESLGALLALYEHCVFVQSVIWGINPFDQCGVEYGKLVARQYAAALDSGDPAHLPPIGKQVLTWRS